MLIQINMSKLERKCKTYKIAGIAQTCKCVFEGKLLHFIQIQQQFVSEGIRAKLSTQPMCTQVTCKQHHNTGPNGHAQNRHDQ